MRRYFFGLAICLVASGWTALAQAESNEASDAIATALRDSGRMKNYSIGVTHRDGVVILEGRVASQEQMQEAVQLTSSMPGVTRVISKLQVKSGGIKKAAAPAASPMMPDPSLPAPSGPVGNDLVSRLRANRASVSASNAARQANSRQGGSKQMAMIQPVANEMPASPYENEGASYPVQQVSQNAPRSFAPPQGGQMPMPRQPQPGGQRMAMGPVGAAAGMMAGAGAAAMGARQPGPGGMQGSPMPMYVPGAQPGVIPASYDQPHLPNYAWPSYSPYPNYGAVSYPRQYSPTAWPYIGPFYPYPQVPLGWRKVTLEWDDGWWMLNFND